MSSLNMVKEILHTGGHTCVIISGGEVFTSERRGVAPLVSLCSERGFDSFTGASAADKVVGRATAFLYLLLGVSELYANVISEPALSILKENGVSVEYGELVKNIINRVGDGICPFESAVISIENKTEAFSKITERMKKMNI